MAVTAREFGRERGWIVARRIRQRRHDLSLTQPVLLQRLAKLGLHLSQGGLSQIEKAGADVGKLPVLAVALECTVSYLIGLTDEPTKWEPDESLEVLATRV